MINHQQPWCGLVRALYDAPYSAVITWVDTNSQRSVQKAVRAPVARHLTLPRDVIGALFHTSGDQFAND